MNRKHITREEAEQFSKELYKELIAYNWTEEEANGMAGNIDYLISNISLSDTAVVCRAFKYVIAKSTNTIKGGINRLFSFSFLNFADKSQETSAGIPWFLKPILLHFNPIFLLSVAY